MFSIVKPAFLQRPVFYVKAWPTEKIRTLICSSRFVSCAYLSSVSLTKLEKSLNQVCCSQCLLHGRGTTICLPHFSTSYKFQQYRTYHNGNALSLDNPSKKINSLTKYSNSQGFLSSCGILLSTVRNINCRQIHCSPFHASKETCIKLVSDSHRDQPSLQIKIGDRKMLIPAVWLRDHCMSPEYYNHETQQKNADPSLLTRSLKIDSVDMTRDGSGFTVAWSDGHVSKFAMDWLQSNYYNDKSDSGTKRIHWDKEIIESQPLPVVSYSDHMTLETGLAETVGNICKYGFSIVEGCDDTEKATQNVVERLSFVQETLFGRMWTFSSDGQRSDTAYSTQALGSHTDTACLETPIGIQVFHCLKHTGSGGETLLVDGFRSLQVFRETCPEDFDLLTNTVVPHEYKEEPSDASPGYHMYSLGTTVRVHPASGEFIQLRFNPYDRAPLNTVSALEIPPFYRAYGRLYNIILDPAGQFWLKLKPGQVLFIDNWRIMHGRAAFDGTRVMCGCYLPRDEWVSKARVLGVW